MHTKKIIQKTVRNFFKSILDSNPDILKKYVEFGLNAVDMTLPPLNSVMKHLVVIQGLDPNTIPGDRDRKALEKQLFDSFNKTDHKDYDDDYDFSWAHARFEKTRRVLGNLNLTKDEFNNLTNLTGLESPVDEESNFFSKNSDKLNQVAPPSARRTTLDVSTEMNKRSVDLSADMDRKSLEIDKKTREFENWLKENNVDERILRGKMELLSQKIKNPSIFESENPFVEESDAFNYNELNKLSASLKKQPIPNKKAAPKKVAGRHVKSKKQ